MKRWKCAFFLTAVISILLLAAGAVSAEDVVQVVLPHGDFPTRNYASEMGIGDGISKEFKIFQEKYASQGPTEVYCRLDLPKISSVGIRLKMPLLEQAEISCDVLLKDKRTVIRSSRLKTPDYMTEIPVLWGTLPAGTYYLRLYNFWRGCTTKAGMATRLYTDRYCSSYASREDDADGANNSRETASLLKETASGYLSFTGNDPEDWYRFSVGSAGASLKVYWDWEFDEFSIKLFKENGESVEGTDAGFESFSCDLPQGNYYLCLVSEEYAGYESNPGRRGGGYSLRLRQNAVPTTAPTPTPSPAVTPVPTAAPKVSVKSITISRKTLTLRDMQTYTLKASAKMTDGSAKNVTWASSNTSVARVNQKGLVTAVKKGTAYIKASCQGRTVSCKLVVKPRIRLKSFTLNYAKKTLKKGSSFKLIVKTTDPVNATIKTVTWTSSNKKTATVSSKGVVKGIAKGKTVITATSKDGKKKKKCVLTVK